MEDKGPIFYSQLRVGKNGIPFTIWKLRSMKVNAEKNGVKSGQLRTIKGLQKLEGF